MKLELNILWTEENIILDREEVIIGDPIEIVIYILQNFVKNDLVEE